MISYIIFDNDFSSSSYIIIDNNIKIVVSSERNRSGVGNGEKCLFSVPCRFSDQKALEIKVEERHFLGGWIRFIFSKISKRIQADKIWWTLVLEIPQRFAISARLCPFCRSSLIFSVSAICGRPSFRPLLRAL